MEGPSPDGPQTVGRPSLPLTPSDANPPTRTFTLKPKEFARVNAPPGTQEASAAHDVFAIRREIREREQALGLNELAPKPAPKSRRRRDYWLLLVTVDTALVLTAWLGRANVFVLTSAAAGVIVVSVGLTWIMWFVMDDY